MTLVWIKILEQSWCLMEFHVDIQSTFYIMNFAYQMVEAFTQPDF